MGRKEFKHILWIAVAMAIFAGVAYAESIGGEQSVYQGAACTVGTITRTIQASQVIMDTQRHSAERVRSDVLSRREGKCFLVEPGRSSSAEAGIMVLFGIGLLGIAALIRWRLRA